eukprot:scaffold53525_cov31-Tisochrysis_lutea.AAC.2
MTSCALANCTREPGPRPTPWSRARSGQGKARFPREKVTTACICADSRAGDLKNSWRQVALAPLIRHMFFPSSAFFARRGRRRCRRFPVGRATLASCECHR